MYCSYSMLLFIKEDQQRGEVEWAQTPGELTNESMWSSCFLIANISTPDSDEKTTTIVAAYNSQSPRDVCETMKKVFKAEAERGRSWHCEEPSGGGRIEIDHISKTIYLSAKHNCYEELNLPHALRTLECWQMQHPTYLPYIVIAQ